MLAALARQLTPDSAAVPDDALLDRFVRAADGAAFELLVWRHGAMVWATARRVLGPDLAAAEDAAQAAFLALARHAGRVRGGSVGPWLHRVAVRAALDLRADGRGRCELPDTDPIDPHPGPECVAAEREERMLIDAAVNALPERLRAAFVLCELEGRSNADAAAVLGCPVGTVESRLTRARQRLRTVLAARGVTPALAVGAVALPVSTRAALVNAAGASAAVRALAARAIRGHGAAVRAAVVAGLVLVATAAGFGLAADPPPARPVPTEEAKANPPAPKADATAADDAPPRPVARFGSTRLRHAAAVRDLAFAPDGRRLASVAGDNTLRVWDADTGEAAFTVRRHDRSFDRVGYADNGKTLIAVSTAAPADLWRLDAKTGAVLKQFPLPVARGAARLTLDGARLALADPAARRVSVTDTRTGAAGWAADLPRPDVPTAVAFTNDGKTLAVATAGGTVRLFDGATGAPGAVFREDGANFAQVVLSPTGVQVAAASADPAGGIVAWDTKTGAVRWRSPAGADRALAATRDGRLLFRGAPGATSSTLYAPDGTLPNTCGVPGTFFEGVSGATAVVAYAGPHHYDDDRVAFGLPDGGIGVFGLHTDRQGKALATADPLAAPTELRFTPDGKTLRARAGDWYEWDVATGKQTRLTTATGKQPLSPDGRLTARLMSYAPPPGRVDINNGFIVEVRDAATGRFAHLLRGPDYRAAWYAFTPDGAGLMGAGEDGTLRVWDYATGNERFALVGHTAAPRHHAFSTDGKALVTAVRNAPPAPLPVFVWDLTTGRPRAALDPGRRIDGVAVSRDGGRMAMLEGATPGRTDGPPQVTVWDTATGAALVRVPLAADGGSVALSPDGALVAVAPATVRPDVRVFATAGGAERFVFRHAGPITGIAFAPDGRTLAVASSDTPVTLWDVSGGKR
ncbi:sigma-70 family RNA polymerase sigma factor [bacterium]|nr:sigma-70 family RNA polymerase sigma factor [bacterium]